MKVGRFGFELGPRRQLFVDEMLVEQVEGIRRVLHQPEKYDGNPVLTPTLPEEQNICILHGTVLFDPADQVQAGPTPVHQRRRLAGVDQGRGVWRGGARRFPRPAGTRHQIRSRRPAARLWRSGFRWRLRRRDAIGRRLAAGRRPPPDRRMDQPSVCHEQRQTLFFLG